MVPFQKVLSKSWQKQGPTHEYTNLSKTDKRYMHDGINTYFDDNLSKIQCGFRKDYSAHHCLFYIIVKIRKRRDSKRVFATVHVSCCWQKYVLMPFIYACLSQ